MVEMVVAQETVAGEECRELSQTFEESEVIF